MSDAGRVRVTGLPLLLAGALLVLSSGIALLVREDIEGVELAGAMLLMGGGLIMMGAWSALEIRYHRTDDDDG
jgi:hypothetical protein